MMPRIDTTITTTARPLSTFPTVLPMWRRLRRRTMAPSRPAVYPDQIGLLILSLAVIGAGIYLVVRILIG
jgi:hypothetical protein